MFTKGGSEYISSLISEALSLGKSEVTVKGDWEIASAVRLPSDFTLILDDCHLCMKEGVYDNMFVNEHHGTYIGKSIRGTDRNISIIGRGRAILDGGKYNGLSERNSRDVGIPIYKNNLLLFTNVDGIVIKNISCRNQRWWALNFVYCRNGHLSDIDFCSTDIWIDESGCEHHGLLTEKYDNVLVKNSDGIDLRQGCSDFIIENITGFTEDDTVALTNLNGTLERAFAVAGLPSDICRVSILHVHSAAFCSIVRLLNQGELKLHDIVIEDIYDTAPACPYLDKSGHALRIGDASHMYGSRHSTKDETYNISVKDVFGCGSRAAIHLAGAIGNLTLENLSSGDNLLIEDFRTE